MGIAGALIYREKTVASNHAFFRFIVQLLLNFSWSIIFFKFLAFWIAFIVIILMNLAVLYTITLFRKINKYSAWLMLPYQLWILYAAYLNRGVALLN